jgi:hypothetical protein
MNRFLKTSLIATLAITSIAGTSYAAGLRGGSPTPTSHDEGQPASIIVEGQAGMAGSGGRIGLVAFDDSASRKADHAIRHWRGGPFAVQPVGQIDDDANRAALQDRRAKEPREVAAVQSAVEHNRALVAKLKAENVEIKNIVGADAAFDGGLTLYVL